MKGSSSKLWLDSLIKALQVPVLICPGKSTVGAPTKKSAPTRPPTESANSSTHQFLSYWSILEFEIDIWICSSEIYIWNMCYCARSHFKDTSWIWRLCLVTFNFFSLWKQTQPFLFSLSRLVSGFPGGSNPPLTDGLVLCHLSLFRGGRHHLQQETVSFENQPEILRCVKPLI